MRARKPLPHIDELRRLFAYNEEGFLVRKVETGPSTYIGQEVRGCLEATGYRSVCVKSKYYLLHRVIWQWHYGETPDIIDHDDRNKSNNRIGNLRDSTAVKNALNTSKIYANVNWNEMFYKWVVSININKLRHREYEYLFCKAARHVKRLKQEQKGL